MNIKIVCVGKLKESYLKEAISEYSKRLTKYCVLTIDELEEEKISIENDSYCNISKEKEGKRILSRIKEKDYVVLLSLDGETLNSVDFSEKIDKISQKNPNIVFVIGGSYGVSEDIYKRANYKFSFSKLTFPHQLFRVMLLEQIYRAFKIQNNEKYHK